MHRERLRKFDTVPVFIITYALNAVLVCSTAMVAEAAMGATVKYDTTISPIGEFAESLQPTRPVSGDMVAGFSGEGRGSVAPFRVEAWVPEQWRALTFCVMVRSRDGRYEAYQTFEVPADWESDFHVFDFDKAREKDFLKNEAEQLATSVYLGSCGTETMESTAAYWGGRGTQNAPEHQIFLNSRRADETSVYFFTDSAELPCKSIDAADRQVFDFLCVATARKGAQEIEVNRIRKGNYDTEHKHILYFPALRQ